MSELTLKEILQIAVPEIKAKVEQQYFIDTSLALLMAKYCKTVAECNLVLAKRYNSSRGNCFSSLVN